MQHESAKRTQITTSRKQMKHLLLFHFGECLPALPPVAVRIYPFPLPSVYSMFQPVRLYSANSNKKKKKINDNPSTNNWVSTKIQPSYVRLNTWERVLLLTSSSCIFFTVQLTVSFDCFWFSFSCSVFYKKKKTWIRCVLFVFVQEKLNNISLSGAHLFLEFSHFGKSFILFLFVHLDLLSESFFIHFSHNTKHTINEAVHICILSCCAKIITENLPRYSFFFIFKNKIKKSILNLTVYNIIQQWPKYGRFYTVYNSIQREYNPGGYKALLNQSSYK